MLASITIFEFWSPCLFTTSFELQQHALEAFWSCKLEIHLPNFCFQSLHFKLFTLFINLGFDLQLYMLSKQILNMLVDMTFEWTNGMHLWTFDLIWLQIWFWIPMATLEESWSCRPNIWCLYKCDCIECNFFLKYCFHSKVICIIILLHLN
jgi:hypothetical protein